MCFAAGTVLINSEKLIEEVYYFPDEAEESGFMTEVTAIVCCGVHIKSASITIAVFVSIIVSCCLDCFLIRIAAIGAGVNCVTLYRAGRIDYFCRVVMAACYISLEGGVITTAAGFISCPALFGAGCCPCVSFGQFMSQSLAGNKGICVTCFAAEAALVVNFCFCAGGSTLKEFRIRNLLIVGVVTGCDFNIVFGADCRNHG